MPQKNADARYKVGREWDQADVLLGAGKRKEIGSSLPIEVASVNGVAIAAIATYRMYVAVQLWRRIGSGG